MSSVFFSQRRASRPAASLLKVVGIAILVIGLLFVFSGCGKASLVGKWHSAGTGETLEFTSGGKMLVTSDTQEGSVELTYKVDGNKVAVSLAGVEMVTAAYSIDGDTLTMDDPDTGKPETYDRVK
jgi:uncharacterized protein (TIGR03066 family)